MALEEDKITGSWKERSVCMGDTKTCSFPGLINHHHKFIISFAEDESGELYFLATSYPSTLSPLGTVFKFMDPSRRAPPGKCRQKHLPVKVKGKTVPFVPRELTVLDTKQKPTRPPPRKFRLTTRPPLTTTIKVQTTTKSPRTTVAVRKPKWKLKTGARKDKLWKSNKLNKQVKNNHTDAVPPKRLNSIQTSKKIRQRKVKDRKSSSVSGNTSSSNNVTVRRITEEGKHMTHAL